MSPRPHTEDIIQLNDEDEAGAESINQEQNNDNSQVEAEFDEFGPIGDNAGVEQINNLETNTDILGPKRRAKIPLRCDLCPNSLTFSDTSHLLTHMNSKSHIFHHWNLELFKEVNPRIRTALQNFQEFWEEHDLAGRIRARMIKRNQVPRIAADTTVPEADRQVHENNSATVDSKVVHQTRKPIRRTSDPEESVACEDNFSGHLLPSSRSLLADFKYDPDTISDSFEAYPSDYPPFEDSPTYQGGSRSSVLYWRGPSSLQVRQDSVSSLSPYYPALGYTNRDSPYPELDMARGSRQTGEGLRPSYRRRDSGIEAKHEDSEDDRSFPSEEATDDVEPMKQEDFKPKGQQFDGMGGFDAASNVQKRKRNQRKNPEVLVQLRANSESVTTDEHVFDSQFNLQRVRDVFDESDISEQGDEDDASTARGKKRQSSSTKISTSTKKPRKRQNKRANTPKPAATKPAPRTKRASARAAQAAITKIHQAYPIEPSFEDSPSTSRAPSAQSGVISNNQLSTVQSLSNQAIPELARRPFTLSSSGINSLEGRRGRHSIRTSSGHISGHAGMWLPLKTDDTNAPFKMTTAANRPYHSPLHFGKENDPSEFYARDLSANGNPYFAAPEPRIPEAFNPLYVQQSDQDRGHFMPSFEGVVQADGAIRSQIHRNAPFPSMHLPLQHDRLSHHKREPASDVQI